MNMTLQEAVDRLRGEVGSPVDVYIDRAGVQTPKKFTIVRDYIRPPAIDPPPRIFSVPANGNQPAAKVGYFRIISFSANTESDLTKALSYFEREKVKGIVMDLRGNPGGLYDQAQKVADAFIESGVLVSMVGPGGAQRKDEHATRNGDTKVPLAVLVSQTSASASEIVAGALKNLDRGVIIGEPPSARDRCRCCSTSRRRCPSASTARTTSWASSSPPRSTSRPATSPSKVWA
jgi:carboxyl-terminal processing protease